MSLPADRRYTASHEWVRPLPDGTVEIGITDFAQAALGDLVYVELPEVGREFAAEQAIAVVESVKAASDVYAPIAGKVLEVHVAEGDPVAQGQLLFVVEAMKMQFEISAQGPGRVAAVRVRPGQVLQGPEPLADLEWQPLEPFSQGPKAPG